jgi:hypothetical protein
VHEQALHWVCQHGVWRWLLGAAAVSTSVNATFVYTRVNSSTCCRPDSLEQSTGVAGGHTAAVVTAE